MATKSKSISLKAILITIGVGIWVIVLQNAGVIPTSQKVKVTNDVKVSGTVDIDNVKNTVNVSGDVDVNIKRINGKHSFYDHNGDGNYNRIPVYSGY